MHISWLGLSAFKLETKNAVLVVDPYGPSVAPRPLRAKADIVTVSNPGSPVHGHLEGILGAPFVIDHPGEFEVKEVFIQGISAGSRESGGVPLGHPAESRGDSLGTPALRNFKEIPKGTPGVGSRAPTSEGRRVPTPDTPHATPATLFTFDSEDLRLAHVGDLRTVPSDDTLEKIGEVDVLFLPVGGGDTLDAEDAMRVVNAIEPRIVVPMHFRQEGWKATEKFLPVAAFLREIGASKIDPVERFSIKKRDVSGEETSVVLFSA
ncbi:MAG: MBL fold metallo-hydrolase [bacterium]|nr:MBL fold metallo-hydrolase [bacterium]